LRFWRKRKPCEGERDEEEKELQRQAAHGIY
jgi:hypothetical protein